MLGDKRLLRVRLAASPVLAGASVIAVEAAMAFRPLGAYHRTARAAKQAAKGKIVSLPDFPRLALYLQAFLDGIEELGRDDRLVFALERLPLPVHDADEKPVGEKLPDRPFRPCAASPALDAKLEQPLRNRIEAVQAFRIFLEDGLDDLGLLRVGHDVAQPAVVDISDRLVARPFATAQLLANASLDVSRQPNDVVGGAPAFDAHEQAGVFGKEFTGWGTNRGNNTFLQEPADTPLVNRIAVETVDVPAQKTIGFSALNPRKHVIEGWPAGLLGSHTLFNLVMNMNPFPLSICAKVVHLGIQTQDLALFFIGAFACIQDKFNAFFHAESISNFTCPVKYKDHANHFYKIALLIAWLLNILNANMSLNYISRNPPVTIDEMRKCISHFTQNDEAARKPLIDFIYHRLNHRYIKPLLHIEPSKLKSGFLTMAVSCLLIEALQSFYEGLDNTKDCSATSFGKFFKRNAEFFPDFSKCFPGVTKKGAGVKIKDNFYVNIRCGILHQAETTGGYSILRDKSSLFDAGEKSINADKFLQAVEDCLSAYIKELKLSPFTSNCWKMAVKKIGHICDNCQS